MLESNQNMNTSAGATRLDSGAPDQRRLDALFATLFMTSFGALVVGNVLLLNAEVLRTSVLMWIPCFGILLIFYALSRLMGGLAWGACAALVLVYILVWLRQPWVVVPLFYVMMLAALIYALVQMRPHGIPWWAMGLMSILAVVICFSTNTLYNSFDNLNAARAGVIHKDALFHSSIAAMIKNYRVNSTGLHGLVELPRYYLMTHYVVALLSVTSGQGVFEVYGIITFVLWMPLLVFSATYSAVALSAKRAVRPEFIWGVVCLLLVLPQRCLSPWGVNPQFLMSESSLLSYALFTLSMPLMLKQNVRWSEVGLVGLVTTLLAFTKLSTAAIYVGLWGARWLVINRARATKDLVIVLLSATILGLFFLGQSSIAGDAPFGFLHYLRLIRGAGSYIEAAHVQWVTAGSIGLRVAYNAALEMITFFFFHFFFSWIVLGGMVWRRGLAVLWKSPLAVCVWASMVGGAIVLFFFKNTHGGAYYFSHPAFIVALPAFAAWVGAISRRKGNGVIAAGLVAAIIWICMLNVGSFLKYSRWSVLHSAKHESAIVDALLSVRRDVPVNVVLRAPPRLWEREQPIRWGGFPGRPTRLDGEPWPSAAPFLYPAISERAWIGVIPPATLPDPSELVSMFPEDPYHFHGYCSYNFDRVNGGVLSPPVLLPGMTILNWKIPAGANMLKPEATF